MPLLTDGLHSSWHQRIGSPCQTEAQAHHLGLWCHCGRVRVRVVLARLLTMSRAFVSLPLTFAMEFASGGDLKTWLISHERHVTQAFQLLAMKQLTDAVVYLHERRVVHRDLAARNVLVFEQPLSVKLGDFGCKRGLASVCKRMS